jgi:ABC-type molybdate transport system substrate-binding protein
MTLLRTELNHHDKATAKLFESFMLESTHQMVLKKLRFQR